MSRTITGWATPKIKAYIIHLGDPSDGRLVFAKYGQRAKGFFFREIRCVWEDIAAERIPSLDHLATYEGIFGSKEAG